MTGSPLEAPHAPALGELAPRGRLRVALNFGNPILAQRDPSTGAPRGISIDIAHELARRLGVGVDFVPFDAAGQVCAALAQDAWDLAFLAVDPARAQEIGFTPPYLVIEASYLVPSASPLTSLAEVDRAGIRIASGKGAAYDLHLSRSLAHAQLVRADTAAGVLPLFREQGLDAAAGIRPVLVRYAQAHPGHRVIDGSFMTIAQAMGTPRPRTTALAFLAGFVEEIKREGFVAAAIERHGQRDARVAPAA